MPPKKPRSPKVYDAPALYDYAVGAMGRRMRTVAELKRLLRQKTFGQPGADILIEAVIQKLKSASYLDDAAYAAVFSSSRLQNQRLGRRRVSTDLMVKGVHGDVIEKALAETYNDVDEEQLARQYLARKRLRKPADQKQAARIFRALTRAGFRSQVIFRILKDWAVDDELLSALETEEAPQEDQERE